MSASHQPAVLSPPPARGRVVTLRRRVDGDPRAALARLAAGWDPEWGAVGLGSPLVRALGAEVAGLRPFPSLDTPFEIPVTQGDLWISVRGADSTEVFDRGEQVVTLLDDDFAIADAKETFCYAGGRDLTGYEDGTANPPAEEAEAVAICGADTATPGASFVAVQRWVHDLAAFRRRDEAERDAMIGRRHADNEEIEDAPESSHVKRTAQELYTPEAFMMRRSQPFADATECGLEFIAYCRTLDAFERMMKHMAGLDDGVTDALFAFSRPTRSGYYWIPPVRDGRLDLSSVGI